MPYPVAASRNRNQPGEIVLPSRWLSFDGVDDYVTLPAGEGDEPTTALTIEAWLRSSPLENAFKIITSRGSSMRRGYSLMFNTLVGGNGWLQLCIDKGAVYETITQIPYMSRGDTCPWHLAATWDGVAGIIGYFVNGVYVAQITGVTGTLEYTGDNWLLGDSANRDWYTRLKAQMALVRISNSVRYATSFTPPTDFVSDANTVALYKCTEGSGTALADSGPGSHAGAFKGAGEPAWGDVVDLSEGAMSAGTTLWTSTLAAAPAVTGTNVYLYRVSADEYHVFRKIHETGPRWAKWVVSRASSATLCINFAFAGAPDPANNTPSSWSTGPNVQLLGGGVNEYVFTVYPAGGSNQQWGSGHGYETMDSEGWYVDGALTTLSDGQWANGATVEYRSTYHHNDQTTAALVCNITKAHLWSSALMYVESSYAFAWQADVTVEGVNNFPLMMCMQAALTTVNFSAGGTDYPTTGSATAGYERSHVAAAWNADNEAILATWIDFADGLRYAASQGGVLINKGLAKVYFMRPNEIDGALAGSTWAFNTRWLALDGCGNHFLKTT